MMGSPESDNRAYMDERWHKVDIRSGFAMAIYPVTYDEYAIFAQIEGRGMPDDGGWGGGKRPVTNVSYKDATEFASWLTRLTGHRYRLELLSRVVYGGLTRRPVQPECHP